MNESEATSAVKALYLQAAALAGFEVSPFSPERFVELVRDGFNRVPDNRRSEAVSNILRVIGATLVLAQEAGVTELQESDVDRGKEDVCPVFPFD